MVEEILARVLGLWPLPKLGLILLLLEVLSVGEGCNGCLGLSLMFWIEAA